MKTYYNETTGQYYYEGRSMTRQIDEHTVWSGVPSDEQLAEWGFEEVTVPVPTPAQTRMQ